MSVKWILVQTIVWYSVYSYGLSDVKNEVLEMNGATPVFSKSSEGTIIPALNKLARDIKESVAIDWNATDIFEGKSPTTPTSSPPSPAPIIIQAPSPSHETIWKRHSPRIHLQPEVHVHQGDDHHQPSPSWTWADEGRSSQDLAYKAWLPTPAH